MANTDSTQTLPAGSSQNRDKEELQFTQMFRKTHKLISVQRSNWGMIS